MTRLIPAVAALMLSAAPVMAERVSVLVFDASGSMWNRVEGDLTRIEVARDVMGDYFGSRDGAVPLSVIAYGHNRRGDCGDIEVIAPMGQTAPGTLESRLRGLMPRGMTPLTDSLRMARGQIPQTAEAADIILVTDGLETCEGDPCALAAELAAEGIDIRAHVVGFGLTRVEVEALSCITEQTGGMLFQTNSGAELADALRQVSAVVPEPEPQPAPKATPARVAAFDIGAKAEAGFAYPISWTGAATFVDYMGFVPQGETNGAVSPSYGVIGGTGENPNNPATRTAPKEPGMYDLILVSMIDGVIARQPVEVVPPSMGFEPIGSVEPGSRVRFAFRGPERLEERIVIAGVDQPVNEHQRHNWAYALHKNGATTLRVPTEPGEYEVRYLNRSRSEIMFSRRFGVGIPFEDADLTTSADLATQAATATRGDASQDNIASVPATFRLPADVPQNDVSWGAVPLDPDMSPEAWAPTDTGPVISGTFEPGRWRVTAYAPGEVELSAEVEIYPGQVNDFTVQLQEQIQGGGDEDHGALMLDGPWRVLAVPPRDAPAGSPTEVMDMLRITLRTRADANGWDGSFTPTALMVGPQTPLDTAALTSVTEEEGYVFLRFPLPAVSPEDFVISLGPYEDAYSGTMASGPNSLPVVFWPEGQTLPALGVLQDHLYGPGQQGNLTDPAPVTQSMGCDEPICQRASLKHGLEAQIPNGWMMWQVERVDGAVTAQFTNGTDVLMLMGNAVWPTENGPCLTTSAGPLCYWSNTSAEAQIAAAFIAANLKRTTEVTTGAGQQVRLSLPDEPIIAGSGGYFPVILTAPDGFQGSVTLHPASNLNGPALFTADAAFVLGAQDQVLPVPDQPGLYEVQILDASGALISNTGFEVLAADAGEGQGSMAIEPDGGERFVGRGPYLAGAEVLVQINRGQDKRSSDQVAVLVGGTDTVLPDTGTWLDDFRAGIRMPDAPGTYFLALFDAQSSSFRAMTEISVLAGAQPELRNANPNPAVRRPYSVAVVGRMALADRLAIVAPNGTSVVEAGLYDVVIGNMRIPEGISGPHELRYLAGDDVLARVKLDVGGPPPLVPSGGSDSPAALTMEGDLVPSGMVRVSVRGMIPPQATVGFIGVGEPDRTILDTGSRVTPDALEVEVKVPDGQGPWALRLIDQNLIRVAEIVPGDTPSSATADSRGTIIPIDLGTMSPEDFRTRLRPAQSQEQP
ncbi:MAG: vWA domain-containing protein [Paracoccaceae bacterium]